MCIVLCVIDNTASVASISSSLDDRWHLSNPDRAVFEQTVAIWFGNRHNLRILSAIVVRKDVVCAAMSDQLDQMNCAVFETNRFGMLWRDFSGIH